VNVKFLLNVCLIFLSAGVLAQNVETTSNSVSTHRNTVLPESQNNLQLATGPVLYNNGPLVNSLGTGAGGLDESILQSLSLGMGTLGLGHQIVNNNRVADDFTIASGSWNISQIEFFAYQTNQTASSITAVHLQIWDGPPGQVGSHVIFGDMTTNRMSQTAAANILRVTESSTGIDTDRQIAVSVVDVNTTLSAGSYWLEWQADGTGGSGPWAPPITINGSITTGNGLQSTDGGVSYSPANDTGTSTQMGFPFIIYGGGPPPVVTQVPAITFWGLMALVLGLLFFSKRYIRQ